MDVFSVSIPQLGLSDPERLMLIILGSMLLWASFTDFRERRIPNIVCALIACAGLAWQAFYAGQLILALAVAFAVLAVGFLLNLKGIFGAGDVKLIAALTIWAGPNEALVFLLHTLIAGGAVSLLWLKLYPFYLTLSGGGLAKHAREIPYAVPVTAGAFLMMSRLWPGV